MIRQKSGANLCLSFFITGKTERSIFTLHTGHKIRDTFGQLPQFFAGQMFCFRATVIERVQNNQPLLAVNFQDYGLGVYDVGRHDE